MTNTEFKAMNIEELDLVTGGVSRGKFIKTVQAAVKSGAPKAFIAQTANDIQDTFIKLGDATENIGKEIYKKVTSWF